jgi:ABC-type glycerol-3-phosphate transport system substrate-binding protein
MTMGVDRNRRTLAAVAAVVILAAACGPRGGATNAPLPTPAAAAPAGSAATSQPTATPQLSGTLDVWTLPQGDDEKPIKAYGKAFEAAHPGVKFKLLVVSEDTYVTKVNTALQAKAPPDIAAMEDQTWMQAGKVVEIMDKLKAWGVDVADFNQGALGRATPKGTIASGLYGVGDFLGGNVLVYNKALLDAAGVAYPPADRSLTIDEYADLCRKVGKPDKDPNKSIYGCSMPEWGPAIQAKDLFGPDGRKTDGYMNSDVVVHAYDVAAGLLRDRLAPTGQILEAASESDIFAAGRMGITWTDFTETPKYVANKISFGIAPFFVINSGDTFVDTWTAPWGTFTESKDKDLALEFLHYLATDAQRLRPQISADPPLSKKVADEVGYGKDDPVKAQYLQVLAAAAKPQVFVPPGVEAFDPLELLRQLVDLHKTNTKEILDQQAAASQKELDKVWKRFDAIKG